MMFQTHRMDYALGPFKGHGILVPNICKGVNSFANVSYRGGTQFLKRLSCEDAEPDLNLVQPRSVGGSVVEADTWVSGKPPIVFGLMGVEVIQDNVQLLVRVERDNTVHEVQDLPTATVAVMIGVD